MLFSKIQHSKGRCIWIAFTQTIAIDANELPYYRFIIVAVAGSVATLFMSLCNNYKNRYLSIENCCGRPNATPIKGNAGKTIALGFL